MSRKSYLNIASFVPFSSLFRRPTGFAKVYFTHTTTIHSQILGSESDISATYLLDITATYLLDITAKNLSDITTPFRGQILRNTGCQISMTWHMTFGFLYRWYYPHTPRDSVSAVYGIFQMPYCSFLRTSFCNILTPGRI